MSALFKLHEYTIYDYTKNIVVPSYKVNEQYVYNEWTDSNYKVHRDPHRKKVSGSFTLKFFDKNEFDDFFVHLNTSKELDGSNLCTFYVNNINDVVTDYYHIDIEPENTKPFIGTAHEYEGFEVSIEEV